MGELGRQEASVLELGRRVRGRVKLGRDVGKVGSREHSLKRYVLLY